MNLGKQMVARGKGTGKKIFFSFTSIIVIAALAFSYFYFFWGQNSEETTWLQYAAPEDAGWSSEKLAEAKKYYDTLGSTAVMIITDGKVVAAWGDVDRNTPVHSIRKSFMSALYGIYSDEGKIDINKTLQELNIDDNPPLTDKEKQAKVIHLLKARSGIYHTAALEPKQMEEMRPQRGSFEPDTNYFYNNWDFNALATIFMQETGEDVFEAFQEKIADPLGMEDFKINHTIYWKFNNAFYTYDKSKSIHPGYSFSMSCRDLARFGQLYLQNGRWEGKQVIPEKWVKESTTSYSKTPDAFDGGYGYLWWISTCEPFKGLGTYSAKGLHANNIVIIPGANTVIVHRVNSLVPVSPFMKEVNGWEFNQLITKIIASRTGEPRRDAKLVPMKAVK